MEVIERINLFEELCDFIIFLDEKFIGGNYSSQDPFDIGNMIDEILEG